MFVANKVKFQDHQLDDCLLENAVLKSKLQSKIDALLIMSKELDKCNMERDKYKVLVEQLQRKRVDIEHDSLNSVNMYKYIPTNTVSGSEMLTKTREQNNMLKLEIETLRSKLEEAMGDIVALRKQLQKKGEVVEKFNDVHNNFSVFPYIRPDYEQLLQELENFRNKYQQIQLDYRAILDEKEELTYDRDYYKNKVQRLNHQISFVLSSRLKAQQTNIRTEPSDPVIDINALVTENKYLNERVTQLQVEKEIIKRTLTKYKSLLENRYKGESLNPKKGFPEVMTQRQVREFLDINSKTGLKKNSLMELKSLCLGLFEALNDKTIALQHQRKTNQILANRITELEKTLESWCNGEKCIPIFPTQMLLDELLPDMAPTKEDNSQEKLPDYRREDMETKLSEVDNSISKTSKSSSDTSEDRDDYEFSGKQLTTKTVLPAELEELVKEALAELRDN